MSAATLALPDVLLVDDVRDLRDSLKTLLQMHGYDVRTAADGAEAMSLQRARPARVLITDLFMPGQEGMETIAQFRREWPKVKIIAVSGGGGVAKNSYLPAARMAGADATLPKPFSFQALVDTIKGLVS